ncbi:MAG TPA: hypothetical protein VHA11_14565 [Bryobacteraceae bacterium]|nr:hypothetical protein [Bryobacteraceae bacterium]
MTKSLLSLFFAAALLIAGADAQVFSPQVLRQGDIDTRDLRSMAAGIVARAGARTPRERAEAIWRFFLTDGRFVKPDFWYHIAGWAYEEPLGEVLDPMRQVHSYGFGLCYHIAPLLAAVYDAAGFEDARVWFLTGHTVAEVYYDGAYHHYDSDMLGYTPAGEGDFRKFPVASVRQLERDPGLFLRKLLSPRETRPGLVDFPWYPADLQEGAIGGLAELFGSTSDNYLYAFRRYPQGHTSDFVLRPGERMVLYSRPETPGLFYLPYTWDGKTWSEFPREIAEYHIRTEDGPHSQKDARLWATGRLEYTPALKFDARGRAVFAVRSPYVIIDASFLLQPVLRNAADRLTVETSTDGGRTWDAAGALTGPHTGPWKTEPCVLARSAHGRHTAVSGLYAYLVRITRSGAAGPGRLEATTRFQFNPRTLPGLRPGRNSMEYRPGPRVVRDVLPAALRHADASRNTRWIEEGGQGFLAPAAEGPAELLYELTAPDGGALAGFDAGGRFLDLHHGLAPDKLTAETRQTAARLPSGVPAGSIEWSLSSEGPYQPLWTYQPQPRWLDGDAVPRLLRWPEVDRRVAELPAGTRKVYVRYRFTALAVDDVRLATLTAPPARPSALEITHVWKEGGRTVRRVEHIARPEAAHSYFVEAGSGLRDASLVLSCPKFLAPRMKTETSARK